MDTIPRENSVPKENDATPVTSQQAQPSSTSTNSSGQGAAAIIPPEIRGWNWGAFLWNWIWGLGNGTYIALLALIPFVNIVMAIVLGIKGNEWAWQNKKWASIEEFKKAQRMWAIVGLIIIGLGVLMMITVISIGIFSGGKLIMTPLATSTILEDNTQASDSFDLLGQHYVLADNLSDDQRYYYEFIPEGQDINNWQNLVTLVKDNATDTAATNSDVDFVAQATLDKYKAQGAFVYNSFTATSTQDVPVDVMTLVFTKDNKAEIDIKEIFLSVDNAVEAATYGVTIEASSTGELKSAVNDYLKKTSDIEPQIINFIFPEPWNS
jgi:hypothetical protein